MEKELVNFEAIKKLLKKNQQQTLTQEQLTNNSPNSDQFVLTMKVPKQS